MPALNWETFVRLPESPERNFELLCRGIVRLNFGAYGVLRALANQPGVEFHLKLDKHCDALGEPGRWWGWQCKWYKLAANGNLGTTRRKDIEDGIRKAERHVPGLTDWVLWTRRPLTRYDQEWFNGLSSSMKLHLWTEEEVDNLLSGQAAILRSTYFGELVLSPEILREIHEQSVASIRKRWQPEVHHSREAERDLRRMLGETLSWKELRELSADLQANAQAMESALPVPSGLEPSVAYVVTAARYLADTLDRVTANIDNGDLDLLRDELSASQHRLPVEVAAAPRRLRACNHLAALYATNAVAGCREAIRLLSDIETAFSSRVVAVLASAGCGKTHLAAQLTSATERRPHGVMLHGRDLHASHTLDDLAKHVVIAGQPVASMEALLAAVDAAGQRARHRLPVCIDGLNEAEDPRKWKPLLASLEATLSKYPYVLLVCTLRPDFAQDALPNETRRVEIEDYEDKIIEEVIHKHLQYWKIEAPEGVLLFEFLRHPLTLRLFCEVTNPTREKTVGIDVMPGSLTALFERYLEQVSERIVELAPRIHRFYAQDVNNAITTIASRLWETRSRLIELNELRDILRDTQRPWDQSLVRALEHEGVLLRAPSDGSNVLIPVYDLLGGHIIAKSLLAEHGRGSFESWIKEPSTTYLLAGDNNVRHPLAEDILRSLAEQVPRRFYAKQLWQLVDEPLRGRALRLAAQLEPAFLDTVTVDALLDLARAGDAGILERLWQVRGTKGHPLNAEALDRVLRTMTVADRDLRWTEWLRRNHNDLLERRSVRRDLEHLDQRWRAGQLRSGDRLRACWVMWTLTSTNRRLRDQATRALYWYGRHDPEGLFALTIDSLTVNDPYVSERMLAASYGVVMSKQNANADFAAYLKPFLEQLATALVVPAATAPTHHYLARRYVRGIVAFAAKFYPTTLPDPLRGTWAFGAPSPIQPLTESDQRANKVRQTLHMDFENYTLGRLFDDRRNYDMNHAGHQAAVAHVLAIVWALGWRKATFDALDREIAENAYRHDRGDRPPVERYGKKYGWIGFYTYAGILEDQGLLPYERTLSDVDIDPSFPEEPPTEGFPSVPSMWLSPSIENHEEWIYTSETTLPIEVIRRKAIGGHEGPWLAVHGHISAEDKVLGRAAWAFLSALVVAKKHKSRLLFILKAGDRPLISYHVPSDYYTFAGEIPWHPNFASVALAEDAYRNRVHTGTQAIKIEVLAHKYAWENYHSEMNHAGPALVPSQPFSVRFDLRGAPQTFNQFLPDGSPATMTLSSIDGLEGNILYIREDLLRQYVGERDVIWLVFGKRELRPYPSSAPKWLVDAQRQKENAWQQVFSEVLEKPHTRRPQVRQMSKRGRKLG